MIWPALRHREIYDALRVHDRPAANVAMTARFRGIRVRLARMEERTST